MSTTFKLGRVVGKDATINGVSTLTLIAENGIVADQNGDTLKLSSPAFTTHTIDSNIHVTPEDKARWNAASNVDEINNLINAHNLNDSAHNDIRKLVNTKAPVDHTHTVEDIGADKAGSAISALTEAKAYTNAQIHTHNTATEAHNDIRLLIEALTTRVNALHDVDDETLDQTSEIIAYIKSNKSLIEAITTNKLNVSDIIDNLATNVSNKALAASQGVVIQTLINALQEEVNKKALASDLASHTGNKNNPHGVTADQVGADARGSANAALASAKSYTNDKVTELNSTIGNKANASDLTTHVNNTNNPHGITLAQLGLSTETWTFTLEDGSIVTKAVYIK